jgi:hypothetical protein
LTEIFNQCRRVFSEVDPSAAATESGFDSVSFDAALECVNGLNFQLQKTNAAGRFEWSDGFLVDALQVWQPSLFIFYFIFLFLLSFQYAWIFAFAREFCAT